MQGWELEREFTLPARFVHSIGPERALTGPEANADWRAVTTCSVSARRGGQVAVLEGGERWTLGAAYTTRSLPIAFGGVLCCRVRPLHEVTNYH